MKPIRVAWAGCVLLLVTLWWLADPLPWQGTTFIVLRNAVVNGTGVLAVGVMAVALMLAVRPVLLEPVLGGLDKMYRLHKWLGITGLVMAVLHWVATQSPGWRAGHRRRAYGTVEQITHHDAMRVLEVRLQLKSRWVGHAAGQFVFVRFDGDAEPHPFTLSSTWTGDGSLLLLIKGLGDYTSALPARLHLGDPVRVEGPYGQFNFRKSARRPSAGQIWIGGGIGITPFIARMKHLALHPEAGVVDLFHPVRDLDADAAGKLAQDAQAAGVHLHVTRDDRDGLLTGPRLRAAVPDWIGRDVWFCGPSGLGAALRRDLLTQGLPAGAFHQELFSFR